MRQDAPLETAADDSAERSSETRAWYAQMASISSSVMLLAVLILGCVVAYVIADMRNELYVVANKVRQEAPGLREKDLLIKELREENGQLKVRLEQMQREVARVSEPGHAPAAPAPISKGEKLGEASVGLAGCINAALNGKGSVEANCKNQTPGGVVVKSQS